MKQQAFGTAVLLTCAALSTGAGASSLALDFSGGNQSGNLSDIALGWQFDVLTEITVSDLAFFDLDADGLSSDHLVALWRDDGTFITSVTVTNASPSTASASGVGQWKTEKIAPTILAVGRYRIAASYVAIDPDQLIIDAVATTAPEITYVESVAGVGAGAVFPDSPFGVFDDGVFGPSFLIAPVPLPATAALMLGALAVGGLATRRRVR